jgi:hypothetical protein
MIKGPLSLLSFNLYLEHSNVCKRVSYILGANIFLTSSGCLKLGDFGCSEKLKSHATLPGEFNSLVGTLGNALTGKLYLIHWNQFDLGLYIVRVFDIYPWLNAMHHSNKRGCSTFLAYRN